ncbi:MAG: right-handed parallel beta-helix repeat-containing protein [Desulfobacula sp.]|uniref:right-handed parallel beta-helix repeat-containing protein n=1 Tax=Desulfobacula sp. TaxID=2593537 RepID=UPI0025BEFDDD|nr:right-handed parallel beta-helix repeat-containing protein [Desulfobacula sp.]MCD4722384.1 right-handed parallel beta-helix repeat-containing protein [Desulfobacula sp.]
MKYAKAMRFVLNKTRYILVSLFVILSIVLALNVYADTNVSGNIFTDTTWDSTGNPYIVTEDIYIDAGATLTIEPGVVVKFNSSRRLTNNGSLNVNGMESNPVHFTSNQASPSISDWRGIRFSDNSNGNLNYCIVEYAYSGIELNLQTSPQIMNCTIRNNSYGINIGAVDSTRTPQPIINNCSFYGNSSNNLSVPSYLRSLTVIDATNNWWGTADPNQIAKTISDYGDYHARSMVVDFSFFLDSENGSPVVPVGGETYLNGVTLGNRTLNGDYIVPAYFIVLPGHELTISPGTTIKFMSDGYFEIEEGADLLAGDLEGDPVIFTSWQSAPAIADWKGIKINNSDTVELKNAVVEYAEKGILISGGGSVQVLQTVIRNNQYGVEVEDYNGIASRPVINFCSLYGNTWNYKVEKTISLDPVPLDATNNWWGTADPDEIGETIYDHGISPSRSVVDYSLFLDSENGTPITHAPTGEIYLIGGTDGNTSLDGSYIIPNYYSVINGFELTILPGTILRFMSGADLTVSENAVLNAGESSMVPVTFTSANATPEPNDWTGIKFVDGSVGNLDNCIIEYAQYGVQVTDNSSPLIINCTLRFNNTGIYVNKTFYGSGVPNPVVNYCSFTDNQQYNYYTYGFSSVVLDATNNWWGAADPQIFIEKIMDYKQNDYSSVVNFSSFLDAENGSPVIPPGGETYLIGMTVGDVILNGDYIVPSYYTVKTGHELSILPGSIIKFMTGSYIEVAQDGSMTAGDSQGSSVTFTSFQPSPAIGDWEGIKLNDSDSVVLKNILVEYASTGVFISAGTSTQITDSTIRHNNRGIEAGGYSNDPLTFPVVNQCSIYANQDYNYYVSKYIDNDIRPLDATNNWWGTADPQQIGTMIYDNGKNDRMVFLDYSSFLDSENGTPITHALTGELYLIGGTRDNMILDDSYIVPYSFSVIKGHELTILPGSTLKFMSGAVLTVLENAIMTAGASVGQPATFTSALPDPAPGVWEGIRFNHNSTGTINNSIVEYADIGIYLLNDTSPQITDTKIRLNNRGIMGVNNYYYAEPPAPSVNHCYFDNNSEYNYYVQSYHNLSAVILDATHNWWGTSNVQTISEKIYDFGDHSNSPVVDFSSFIFMNGPSLSSVLQTLISSTPSPSVVFKYDFNDDGKTGGEDATYILQHMAGLRSDNQTQIYFNGIISSALTLTLDESPSIVTENVRILPGITVTIEPGVIIKFAQGKNLWVDGELNAIGTETSPIKFTSAVLYPALSAWQGIYFNENATGQITYSIIEYADRGIECKKAGPLISNSTFFKNRHGIYLTDSSPMIQNCLLNENYTAIHCYRKSSPQILANTIIENLIGIKIQGGNISVDENPHPVINNNNIYNNGVGNNDAYNVSIEWFYDAENQLIDLNNNWWGTIVRSEIRDNIYDYSDSDTSAQADVSTILDGENGNTIPGHLLITQISVSQEFINPANNDSSLISFHLDVPLNITIELYKAMMIIDQFGDGTFERAYLMTLMEMKPLPAGMYSIPWDGRNVNSDVVDHSVYVYVIKAFDGDELVDVYDPAYVKTPVSITEGSVNPAQYNPYANEDIQIQYELSQAAWVTIGGQKKLNPLFKGTPRSQGPQTEIWDGLNASGAVVVGELGINMKAESMSENAIVLQDNTLQITDVSSEPYVITPTYGQISTIFYTLTKEAEISISLRDPNGGNWSLIDAMVKVQGNHTFEWDGKIGSTELEKSNGPQGDYTMVITAFDSGNNTTFTKHVNVHVYD